ncbi:proline racemase [Colletotrichum plurivorum]|uniref:trans-L-3-hydroxyproline dehydratase n=1 Tax=Colletotrichum plurivorum TaxID=2175906 RepID=A0A8H6JQV0_9PEZI|nr:proline racemase [Colletotrichum plurivorum]
MSLPSFIRPFVGSEIRTVEMHTSGEPARIVYAGYPDIPGTLLEQRSLAQSQHDHVRRSIVYEPRGHRDMYAAVLRPRTELVEAGDAHMGALFLTHEGYGTMCGHATIALGRFLVDCADESTFPRRKDLRFDEQTGEVEVRLHAPIGLVKIRVPAVKVDDGFRSDASRAITFLSVPTYAGPVYLNVPLREELRWPELNGVKSVNLSVCFGGAFYGIVQATALGFPPSLAKPDIAALGVAADRLKRAINSSHSALGRLASLYAEEAPRYVYGIMITDANSQDDVPVAPGCLGAETGIYFFGDGQIDRSPTGSVVQARVALAVAKEEMIVGESQTYHSLVSRAQGGYKGAFVGKAVEDFTTPHGTKGARVEVSGRAYYTGASTFVCEEGDEVGRGFSFDALVGRGSQ